ncbi:hypothetical protein RCL1_000826 [Eukaryota sp. TZLM3-RCL]
MSISKFHSSHHFFLFPVVLPQILLGRIYPREFLFGTTFPIKSKVLNFCKAFPYYLLFLLILAFALPSLDVLRHPGIVKYSAICIIPLLTLSYVFRNSFICEIPCLSVMCMTTFSTCLTIIIYYYLYEYKNLIVLLLFLSMIHFVSEDVLRFLPASVENFGHFEILYVVFVVQCICYELYVSLCASPVYNHFLIFALILFYLSFISLWIPYCGLEVSEENMVEACLLSLLGMFFPPIGCFLMVRYGLQKQTQLKGSLRPNVTINSV